jgi:hypothetical protein
MLVGATYPSTISPNPNIVLFVRDFGTTIEASRGISRVLDTSRGRGDDGDMMEYVIVEMDIYKFIYTYFYLSNSQ